MTALAIATATGAFLALVQGVVNAVFGVVRPDPIITGMLVAVGVWCGWKMREEWVS